MNQETLRQVHAWGALARIDAKNLSRIVPTGFSVVFIFLFYLLVVFALNFTFTHGHVEARVAVLASNAENRHALERELVRSGVRVEPEVSRANLRLVEERGDVDLILDEGAQPLWYPVWKATRSTGVESSRIEVYDSAGDHKVDLLRVNLGPALGLGLFALALIGTAVPVASLRESGALRQLGTTPIRGSTLVLSLVPTRLLIAAAETGLICGIASARGYMEPSALWSLLVTVVVSLALLFALSFLLAARSRSMIATQHLAVMLCLLLVGAGGGIAPLDQAPLPFQLVIAVLPTTWIMRAASHDLAGIDPSLPVPWLWLVIVVAAVAVYAISAALFVWDRE